MSVAFLDVERDALAVLVGLAGSDGDHLALLRLFLGRVGDDDAANLLLFVFLGALHEDAVVKRSQRHARYSVLRGVAVPARRAVGGPLGVVGH